MNESSNVNLNGEVRSSNVLLGTIGAILGALLGAALWIIIYQLGYVAAIAGIAIVFCSYKGYTLLSKRKEGKAAIIAIIVSVIVLCLAHYFCWGLEIYNQLKTDYEVTLMEAMKLVPTFVFDKEMISTDSEVIIGFFRDLAIGLVLIGVGYFSYIRKDLRPEENKESNSEAIS